MSEEQDQADREEPATPRRREKFRERGQVAKSREVISMLIFMVILLIFGAGGSHFYESTVKMFSWGLENAGTFDLNQKSMQNLIQICLMQFFSIIGPVLLAVPVVVIFGYIMQTKGFVFAWSQVAPDINRVDPFKRFGQMFLSMRIVTESLVNILKVTVIGVAVIWIILTEVEHLPELIHQTPMDASRSVIDSLLKILMIAAIFFVTVAVIDFSWQWYSMEKQMRMSRKDLKDEYKESEGDPLLRSRMKGRMRDLSMNRLIKDVPRADVIITNPTHIAVALAYNPDKDASPRVVAKGKGFWAERIKTIAREHKIMIVEDKLLARALYKLVKVGRSIPVNLYKAVAEILAHVYRMRAKARGLGSVEPVNGRMKTNAVEAQ